MSVAAPKKTSAMVPPCAAGKRFHENASLPKILREGFSGTCAGDALVLAIRLFSAVAGLGRDVPIPDPGGMKLSGVAGQVR